MLRAHTDGYQCFLGQGSDYHRYAMYNNVSLPPPLSADSESDEDDPIIYKVTKVFYVEPIQYLKMEKKTTQKQQQ